jgi:hypothetical protein
MKRKITLTLLAALAILSSCQKDETIYQSTEATSVDLVASSNQEATGTQLSVTFTPHAQTATYSYAIGTEADLPKFEAGTLEGSVDIASPETKTVTFDGLQPGTTYTFFARGYSNQGTPSPTSMLRLRTAIAEPFDVTPQYATGSSAGFVLHCTQQYYTFRYALGTAADKDAFEAGTLEGIVTQNEVWDWNANYFDLQPNTDYVFYAQATDRANTPTPVLTVPIRTSADAPDAQFGIHYDDIFLGQYLISPNDQAGKLSAYIGQAGAMDNVMYNANGWHGDLLSMFASWASSNIYDTMTAEDGPLQMEYRHALMKTDVPLECYVLVYDADKKPCAVRKFNFTTPKYDSTLPDGTVTARVDNTTSYGATYTITSGEGTLGFIYDTVDKAFFENELGGDLSKLRETISTQTGRWAYSVGGVTETYTETAADPGTDYFLAVFPVNGNGFSDPNWGIGSMVRIDFTTLSNLTPSTPSSIIK